MNLRIFSSLANISIVVLFFFIGLFSFSFPVAAYQQTEAVCYSQCAAYKFGWKGDFCWDLFQSQCSVGSDDMVKNMIKLVKDTAKAMITGQLMEIIDVKAVFTAMFVCKPLIEDCIVPTLDECASTCKNISQTFYAPNLSAGNPYGSIVYQNVWYDEDNHQLYFKVTNNGGYAWDIDVTASWGHTRNRDKMVSGGGTLFTEKIPELLFFGARVGSPKAPGDYVTDFLINESNFSGFLAKYKSDANNHYIPPAWYKVVPFTAPEGEYTKVILNVDPNQMIPESGETDNTYILEIDKLPTPVSLAVENLTYSRTRPTDLTEYMVGFDLRNSGEESGNAHIKWYEGDYQSGKNPIHQQEMVIQGLNKVHFDHILQVDVSNGGDSCNQSQQYTLVVFDDEGFIKTRHEFSIPRFSGSISGRVEDLFGKKVIGATITTSAGQSAVVNDSGYYHIKGIPTLGKVTVTAVRPDFSQTETQEVEISFNDSKDKCHIEGLTHGGINFVLKDQDVFFTVTIKDGLGNLINGHVLASNKVWRFDENVNGSGPLSGMQPGEYMFTVSAGGYKTIAQTVSAVPNNQNLEFVLEPLLGRSNDGSLVIQAPQLLWQMDRGKEILAEVTATKDGKRVILYTALNKPDTGKVYFLDAITGNQVKVIPATVATKGQAQVCLETSYDGNTTALFVHNGTFGKGKESVNSLLLFNNQGSQFNRADYSPGGGISECPVSYDGFYIYPGFLINKSLYEYSRMEIKGVGGYSHTNYSALGPLYFLHGNGLIASCKEGDDQCGMTLSEQELSRYSDIKGSIRVVDSSFNDARVIFGGFDTLFLYGNEGKIFEKEVNISGNQEPSASISMGGQYIIYSHREPTVHNADFKIVTTNNLDKTPAYNKDVNENVLFVHANDKGLFYLAERGKTLKYYQVGKYTTDYNPPTPLPSASPEKSTSGLSYYSDGGYYLANVSSFASLEDGVMYVANRNITLEMNSPNGNLFILEGTIFSVDQNQRPILLKGQITADFTSPAIIYAIKFDRFDMNLFRTKLNQFRSGTLDSNEYFVIKNIHTKFKLTNHENQFIVAVENGQVEVTGEKIKQTVDQNKQITIDAQNEVKQSIYLGWKLYVIIIGIFVLVSGILLFIYRKSPGGIKVINILKMIAKVLRIMSEKVYVGVREIIRFLVRLIKKKS